MTISEILSEYGVAGGITIVIILSLIEISPVKINPLSWIFRAIGKNMNKDVTDQLSDIKKDVKSIDSRVDKLEANIDENNAIQCRSRILRFGDEVSHHTNHSRDHFRQIMNDITIYDSYCRNHPEFQNDLTKLTSKRIEEDYIERDKNDTFLY